MGRGDGGDPAGTAVPAKPPHAPSLSWCVHPHLPTPKQEGPAADPGRELGPWASSGQRPWHHAWEITLPPAHPQVLDPDQEEDGAVVVMEEPGQKKRLEEAREVETRNGVSGGQG